MIRPDARWSLSFLLAIAVIGAASSASAEEAGAEAGAPDERGIEIQIKGGVTRSLVSIAVAPGQGGGASKVEELLRRDLDLAGFFKVLPNEGLFWDASTDDPGAPNLGNWSNVGAAGLVTIAAPSLDGSIDLRLYNPIKGEPIALKVKDAEGWQAEVHAFANAVVAYYTGSPGIFGSKIAFVRRNKARLKQIALTDMSGTGVSSVTSNSTINILPSWGAGTIYYTSYADQNPDLWGWSGGKSRKVSGRRGQNSGASYCGGRIALTLSMGGENTDIYVLDASSGKQLQRLTKHWAIDTSPTFSPDCSKIAFVSGRAGSPQIYVVDASGGEERRLTHQGSYNTTPDWSPKGDLIAFTSRDERSKFDVFTVDLSGSIVRLTQDQGNNEDPSWSPDGRYLVFSSDRGGSTGLWIMTDDGRYQRAIPGTSGGTSPAWSQ